MSDDTREVHLERVLRHPVARVFAAWTSAEQIMDWMCPGDGVVAEAVMEPREGGRFRVVMDIGGHLVEHEGRVLRVEPPHLLELTWRSENTGGRDTVLTVHIAEHDDGSRLVLTHRGLPGDAVDPHTDGWTSILEKLASALDAV